MAGILQIGDRVVVHLSETNRPRGVLKFIDHMRDRVTVLIDGVEDAIDFNTELVHPYRDVAAWNLGESHLHIEDNEEVGELLLRLDGIDTIHLTPEGDVELVMRNGGAARVRVDKPRTLITEVRGNIRTASWMISGEIK